MTGDGGQGQGAEGQRGFSGGFGGGIPGGFRVFRIGRDAASRVRARAPWRARPGAGPLERALVGLLTFVLSIPVAVILLAIGLLLLALFLGCAAVFIAFALAMWLVRALLGGGRKARPAAAEDAGRENVRVLPRQDPHE